MIPLEIDFPAFGVKTTSLTIVNNVEGFAPQDVSLRLHAPSHTAPAIEANFQPVQFHTTLPDEVVEHVFEVVTFEDLRGEPWLTGMTSEFSEQSVELLSVSTLREIKNAKLCQRRYLFEIRFIGPSHQDSIVAFSLVPETRFPAVRNATSLPSFRCSLVPSETNKS